MSKAELAAFMADHWWWALPLQVVGLYAVTRLDNILRWINRNEEKQS